MPEEIHRCQLPVIVMPDYVGPGKEGYQHAVNAARGFSSPRILFECWLDGGRDWRVLTAPGDR